jgi:hypothetical protein
MPHPPERSEHTPPARTWPRRVAAVAIALGLMFGAAELLVRAGTGEVRSVPRPHVAGSTERRPRTVEPIDNPELLNALEPNLVCEMVYPA